MADNKKPQTKLKFKELLDDVSLATFSKETGILYAQLHRYTKEGANPTLLMMEQLADGLSLVHKRKVNVIDLLDRPSTRGNKKKAKKKR